MLQHAEARTTRKEEKLGQLLRLLAGLAAAVEFDNALRCELPGWQGKRPSVETVTAAAQEAENFAPLSLEPSHRDCGHSTVFSSLLSQKKGRQHEAQVTFGLFRQLTAVRTHSHEVPRRRFVLTKDTAQRSAVTRD